MLHYKVTPKCVIEALREVGEPNSTLMDEQQKHPLKFILQKTTRLINPRGRMTQAYKRDFHSY